MKGVDKVFGVGGCAEEVLVMGKSVAKERERFSWQLIKIIAVKTMICL